MGMTRREALVAPFAAYLGEPPMEVTIRREKDGSYLVYTVSHGAWQGTTYVSLGLALEHARRLILADKT